LKHGPNRSATAVPGDVQAGREDEEPGPFGPKCLVSR